MLQTGSVLVMGWWRGWATFCLFRVTVRIIIPTTCCCTFFRGDDIPWCGILVFFILWGTITRILMLVRQIFMVVSGRGGSNRSGGGGSTSSGCSGNSGGGARGGCRGQKHVTLTPHPSHHCPRSVPVDISVLGLW